MLLIGPAWARPQDPVHDLAVSSTIVLSDPIEVSLLEDEVFSTSLAQLPLEGCLHHQVLWSGDCVLDRRELLQLLPCQPDASIHVSDLEQFCRLCRKKNKFKTCIFKVQNGRLNIELTSLWTFKKVKLHGLFGYRDKYYSSYLLEPGEPFDRQKHEHSLQKMRETFRQEGYLRAMVHDTITHHPQTKEVTVSIDLARNKRFVIRSVTTHVSYSADEKPLDHGRLKKKIAKLLSSKLAGAYYATGCLNKAGEALRSYLFKKGYFHTQILLDESVDDAQHTVDCTFHVTVHEKKAFVFFGNQFFDDAQLLEAIVPFGRLSWFLPSAFLAEEIVALYHKKGFINAQVQARQEGQRYFFLINEGKRAFIDQIQLRGITAFNQRWLLRIFFQSCLKAPYDDDTLKAALSSMQSLYLRHGFWDMAMLKHEPVPLREDNYRLVLHFDEGKQRMLRAVRVAGYPDFLSGSPFILHKPIPFDIDLLTTMRSWIVAKFECKGYLYVDARPELQEEDAGCTVIWRVTGDDRVVCFGKPIIRGAHRFSSKCILRELLFKPGDVWSKQLLDDSLARLRRLGAFESICLVPDVNAEDKYTKSVLIKVQEDDPFEVRLRGGIQQISKNFVFRTGTTYKFGASVLYKNPFIIGDFFRSDADVTKFYRNIAMSYFRPWIFGLPLSTQIKGYSNRYIEPVEKGKLQSLYRVGQEGILVAFNGYIKPVDFGVNTGIEFMETSKLTPEQAEAINFTPLLIERNIPYLFIEPNIFVDFLDDKLDPKCGSLTVISLKTMMPWRRAAVAFFKVLLQQSFFLPLSHFLVWAMRIRLGHIFNQPFRNIMPFERFYLGGAHSLRGYQPDLAPPLGLLRDEDDDKERLVPQGGRSLINANFELRFALPYHLGLVLFQDVGALLEKEFSEIRGGRLLAASGLGVRYYSPVGPVRLDVGVAWKDEDPTRSRCAWFLTLGHAF